jgi:hypothetical protein
MAARTLPPAEWNSYFDAFSKTKDTTGRVDYAVLHSVLQVAPYSDNLPLEPQRLPLQSLTYDPKDDLLEVVTPHLNHFIRQPREIRVDELDGRLNRLEVVCRDGRCEVVQLE